MSRRPDRYREPSGSAILQSVEGRVSALRADAFLLWLDLGFQRNIGSARREDSQVAVSDNEEILSWIRLSGVLEGRTFFSVKTV